MTKRNLKGWYEKKRYIPPLKRSVAPRHHLAALKQKPKPSELSNFSSLKQYTHNSKTPVNWSNSTDLASFDESIHNKDNPHRNFDSEKVYLTPEEYIAIQKKILSKRPSNHTPDHLFWSGVSKKRVEEIKKEILNGKELSAFVIEYNKDGSLTSFQEGRHRVVALKELGVNKIPVWLMKKRY
jgi:hypothetical protein